MVFVVVNCWPPLNTVNLLGVLLSNSFKGKRAKIHSKALCRFRFCPSIVLPLLYNTIKHAIIICTQSGLLYALTAIGNRKGFSCAKTALLCWYCSLLLIPVITTYYLLLTDIVNIIKSFVPEALCLTGYYYNICWKFC